MPTGIPKNGVNSSWFKKGKDSRRTGFQKGHPIYDGVQKSWFRKDFPLSKSIVDKRALTLSKTWAIPEVKERWRKTLPHGENNVAFNNWSSFGEYGKEFTSELQEQIRERDAYRCQQCFRHQDELRTKNNKHYRLSIHHIDYDKKNNHPSNLISLCKICHGQTNFSRKDWQKYFQEKIIK